MRMIATCALCFPCPFLCADGRGFRRALCESLLHGSLQLRVIMPLTDSPQVAWEPWATATAKLTNIKKSKPQQRCFGSIGVLVSRFWKKSLIKKAPCLHFKANRGALGFRELNEKMRLDSSTGEMKW